MTSPMPPAGGPSAMLDAALRYAARGWPVFPVCYPDRIGCCQCGGEHQGRDVGKAPVPSLAPNGLNSAATNAATVREWWRRAPSANIGIRTGPESGLLVLDVDTDHGGRDSLALLETRNAPLPPTPRSNTGGGGEHYLFRYPEGFDVRNSAGKLGPGLDVRGRGGYIVASPSLHISGSRYEWDAAAHPDDLPLADPPGWLLALLLAGTNGASGTNGHAAAPAIGEIIPEGQRDATLASLAGSMRRRSASEAAILAALREENSLRVVPPLPDADLQRIARSVARYAPVAPPAGEPPNTSSAMTWGAPAPATPLSDLGNGERFARDHGENVRFIPHLGKWSGWMGTHWRIDETFQIERFAHQTVRAIYGELADVADKDERTALFKHAKASEADSKIRAMLNRAKALPGVAITPDALDTDPMLLNCLNGTVDLWTGDLLPHRREDMITRLCPVIYDPAARAPTWERFLRRVLNDSDDLIAFFKRAVGYTLTGDTRERALFITYGSGRNGKTTALEVIADMLGDYALRTPTDTLLAVRHDDQRGPRNDLARLKDARFVHAEEVEEGRRLAEGMVKDLTGNGTISARFLWGEFFEFKPKFKAWLGTNHRPEIRGAEPAIWDRIRLIPFVVRIPDDEVDRQLPDKLRAELSGILTWAVEGCLEWQANGLGMPEEVRAAGDQYRSDMDVLARFLADCCVIAPAAKVAASALHNAYEEWCRANGEEAMKPKWLGPRLIEHGFRRAKGFGPTKAWGWHGVGLAAADGDP
jgi:putative DNA primase/helicase